MPARARVSEKLRRQVFARAKFRCEYCQSPEALSASPFVAEHIVPLACGGRTCAENLACACHGCNLLKADHQTGWDVVARQEVLLFDPRADRWTEHFHWSSNGQEIIPLTSKADDASPTGSEPAWVAEPAASHVSGGQIVPIQRRRIIPRGVQSPGRSRDAVFASPGCGSVRAIGLVPLVGLFLGSEQRICRDADWHGKMMPLNKPWSIQLHCAQCREAKFRYCVQSKSVTSCLPVRTW